jgi:hypothetical protein
MSTNPDGVSHALNQLKERGHAREQAKDVWMLTDEGLTEAGKNQKEDAR